MARKQTAEAPAAPETATAAPAAETAEAPRAPEVAMVPVRALSDHATFWLVAGRFGQVPADQLDGLRTAGFVDDAAEAVEYARSLDAEA